MSRSTATEDQAVETTSRWRAVRSRLPYPLGDEPIWPDGHTRVLEKREVNPRVWREQVIDTLDHSGFDFRVFMVSASGFLTDSYALFATNVILPILAFLYWPEETKGGPELKINIITLVGSVVGQVVFGWLADKIGRRKLYGLELVLVIFATLGMAQASTGLYNNMNILSWIMFYRFFLGMGIGAEYPLSAIITAEFASKRARARMLAAVFLMQPLGQILAAGVGWAVLAGLMRHRGLQDYHDREPLNPESLHMIYSTLDSVWRWVIGVGCIPALLAIIWRFSIPESPRYIMDVEGDLPQAVAATRRQFPRAARLVESRSPVLSGNNMLEGSTPLSPSIPVSSPALRASSPAVPLQIEDKPTFYRYIFQEGNFRYLLASSACWFLLDFCFYALGINSPRPLAALWAYPVPTIDITTTVTPFPPTTSVFALTNTMYHITTSITAELPVATVITSTLAATDPSVRGKLPDSQNLWDPTKSMFDELSHNARDYILTIAVSSLVGSALLILLIDHISRKKWLVWSFFVLGGWFVVLGITLPLLEFGKGHWTNVVIYALCQFFFNLGPNSLTFVIPAEIFSTRFRATCYGIAAASGKIGAIIVTIITQQTQLSTNSDHFDQLLACFSIPLVLGGIIAWVWIPELQTAPTWSDRPKLLVPPLVPSKGLEVLAKGWNYATGPDTLDPRTQLPVGEKQNLGFRANFGRWLRRRGQEKVLGGRRASSGGLPLSEDSSRESA